MDMVINWKTFFENGNKITDKNLYNFLWNNMFEKLFETKEFEELELLLEVKSSILDKPNPLVCY